MVNREPRLIDPRELGIDPPQPLPKDSRGEILLDSLNPRQLVSRSSHSRVRWKLPGNTDDQNLLVGIRNIQGLFLEKFPEFVRLFPRDTEGRIEETRRAEAAKFIADRLDTQTCFNSIFGSSAVKALYFENRYQIAIQRSFEPWGLQIYRQPNPESGVMRDRKGNVCWNLSGNTPEQNEQLAVSNIQALFLEEFPEFRQFFPQDDSRIDEDKRDSAKHFILEKVGTRKKLIALFTGTPLVIPIFGGSLRLLIDRCFSPWGIQFDKLERAPEDCITARALADQLKITERTVKKVADNYREKHPEWFNEYLDKASSPREYFVPELAELIREEFLKRVAPKGWMTEFALERQLKRTPGYCKKVAERYRLEHLEWFGYYRTARRQRIEFWAPELIAVIIEEDKLHPLPPNEWSTPGILSAQLKRSNNYIRKLAGKLAKDHPEWIDKNYRSAKRGFQAEHYSPELTILIVENVGKYTPAPDGWLTNYVLCQQGLIGIKNAYSVNRIMTQFKEQYPAWFGIYLDSKNRPQEHYSPELIEVINRKRAEQIEPITPEEADRRLMDFFEEDK